MADDRFAKNIPYLFMALQYVERTILENQINVSVQKGTHGADGIKNVGDAFSVFTQLKGSAKYWQRAKFELIA